MAHLDFVLWMLGYPLMETAIKLAEYQWIEREKYSDTVKTISAFLSLTIWLGVGAKLLLA